MHPGSSDRRACFHGLHFVLRALQLCCTVIILSVYSYLLAAINNHGFASTGPVRGVEGIAGVATLYLVIAILLLRYFRGVPFVSFVTVALDFCFVWCFVYVAVANRGGAGSCTGDVETPLGSGDAQSMAQSPNGDGFVSLPKLRLACQLLSACLALSILLIFFFIFTMIIEVYSARARYREKRFGPNAPLTVNDSAAPEHAPAYAAFLNWFQHSQNNNSQPNDNALPQHVQPGEYERTGIVESYESTPHPMQQTSNPPQPQRPVYMRGTSQSSSRSSTRSLTRRPTGPLTDPSNPLLRSSPTPGEYMSSPFAQQPLPEMAGSPAPYRHNNNNTTSTSSVGLASSRDLAYQPSAFYHPRLNATQLQFPTAASSTDPRLTASTHNLAAVGRANTFSNSPSPPPPLLLSLSRANSDLAGMARPPPPYPETPTAHSHPGLPYPVDDAGELAMPGERPGASTHRLPNYNYS